MRQSPLVWFALFLILTSVVVLIGVQKGIEKASTILMPIVAMLKYVAPVCLLLILLFAVSEALGIIKV